MTGATTGDLPSDGVWATFTHLTSSTPRTSLFEAGLGGTVTRRVIFQTTTAGSDGAFTVTDFADLQARLGRVEESVKTLVGKVSGMESDLKHVPTTAAMYVCVALGATVVVGAVWALLTWLLPRAGGA